MTTGVVILDFFSSGKFFFSGQEFFLFTEEGFFSWGIFFSREGAFSQGSFFFPVFFLGEFLSFFSRGSLSGSTRSTRNKIT